MHAFWWFLFDCSIPAVAWLHRGPEKHPVCQRASDSEIERVSARTLYTRVIFKRTPPSLFPRFLSESLRKPLRPRFLRTRVLIRQESKNAGIERPGLRKENTRPRRFQGEKWKPEIVWHVRAAVWNSKAWTKSSSHLGTLQIFVENSGTRAQFFHSVHLRRPNVTNWTEALMTSQMKLDGWVWSVLHKRNHPCHFSLYNTLCF